MPLRKRQKTSPDGAGTGEKGELAGKKKKKRQRIVDFFRSRKKKGVDESAQDMKTESSLPKPVRDSKITETASPLKSPGPDETAGRTSDELFQQEPTVPTALPTPPPEPKEKEKFSEADIHALFSGAPQFTVKRPNGRPEPHVSFPWNHDIHRDQYSDAVALAHPAFSAATLHSHVPVVQQNLRNTEKALIEYEPTVYEVPNMLGAQGIEPGSISFDYFLRLPDSDSLITDVQQSQSSSDFLEAVRNKELMQTHPERLGIRPVEIFMVHERLSEFGDILDAFRESPERMTILNNQSVGDLYATLFGKFLTPPGFDSNTSDPTGLKVQIDTLIKILRLSGVWYDFSLVEWRIRLGQILWSEPDAGHGHLDSGLSEPLWTDRDILLLQILLSAELLLRLDAVSRMDQDIIQEKMGASMEEFAGMALRNPKINWDLVLARRFLDNIVVAGPESADSTPNKRRGFLSMLSREEEEDELPISDIVLLPRNQMQQLLGLVHFAESIKWPGIDSVMDDLSEKLGMSTQTQETSNKDPVPVYGTFLDTASPSISVYGTPLPTPRSGESIRSSYFGNVADPAISRGNTTRSLKVPISTSLLSQDLDSASKLVNIGGWLSRSFLSGLILPGEVISHFLISTLLENDKLAIAALGDSANLYGGFVYADRTWWSKNSVAGRVLACVEGAAECMGWISIPGRPEGCADGWYVVDSEPLQFDSPGTKDEADIVHHNSAVVPENRTTDIEPEEFSLPLDPATPPIPSLEFTGWTLIPTTLQTEDHDSSRTSDVESCRATLMFTSISNSSTTHTLTLSNDVYFISSFPCIPTPTPQLRKLQQRLSQSSSLSRSSSKRSLRSMRSTRSTSGRPVRRPSRRNSHGYEPLLSHPPDSPGLGPTRVYSPVPDEDEELGSSAAAAMANSVEMMAPVHPLHNSFKYRIVQVTEVLDSQFLPELRYSVVGARGEGRGGQQERKDEQKEILVLDARGKRDLEVLARAWCAERGLHAVIGRGERSCLGGCVREARGLGGGGRGSWGWWASAGLGWRGGTGGVGGGRGGCLGCCMRGAGGLGVGVVIRI